MYESRNRIGLMASTLACLTSGPVFEPLQLLPTLETGTFHCLHNVPGQPTLNWVSGVAGPPTLKWVSKVPDLPL